MSSSETPLVGSPNVRPSTPRLRSNGSYLKRPRDRSTDRICDAVDDARPKTRRVNPERLATRLDPRLVAEMDAFIVPGAKMPNFAIRKDFQERYCVDRRHIYDYFHSRGLRVAKEDKHNNLLKGRLLKARSRVTLPIENNNEAADKRQDEKPLKVHLRGIEKTENAKLQRQRTTSRSPGTQVTQLHPEGSSLSPTSCDSEEQTSATDSPEPEFAMANGILDNLSISIRAYTDPNLLKSSFDDPYSSYGPFQNECHEAMSSNISGVQEFSFIKQEYTPFVLGEHPGYYDQCFFAQDGSFIPFVGGHMAHDKLSDLCLTTGVHLGHAVGGNGCFEANYGSSRRRGGMATDLIAGDSPDVDFSKWLLTVEAQDGKDDSTAVKIE